MEFQPISTVMRLSSAQKSSLKLANIIDVADLMLITPSEIAKRCKISIADAQNIVDVVCEELAPQPCKLDDPASFDDETITTGDTSLDEALGGGLRTGMVWEIVGESAAGKTQLSLQLGLFVQIPKHLGGLSGSACFLSTSWTLPTHRLLEIVDSHPCLSESISGLSDIHTIKTPTIPVLLQVLSVSLPKLIQDLATLPHSRPLKLLVVDALTELFHTEDRPSTSTLAQRSKHISEISVLLHSIASRFRVAVLVLNEVIDVFSRDPSSDPGTQSELIYRDQARWFNRADSIPGENRKEAALGLAWANQVNARILLSRTERMRYLDDPDLRSAKRRRVAGPSDAVPQPSMHLHEQPIRVRRLSVIFSSVSPPASMDYIVTAQGISVLPEGTDVPAQVQQPHRTIGNEPSISELGVENGSSPLDILASESDILQSDGLIPPSDDDIPVAECMPRTSPGDRDPEDGPQEVTDEWDEYWQTADLAGDIYSDIEFGALSSSNPALHS